MIIFALVYLFFFSHVLLPAEISHNPLINCIAKENNPSTCVLTNTSNEKCFLEKKIPKSSCTLPEQQIHDILNSNDTTKKWDNILPVLYEIISLDTNPNNIQEKLFEIFLINFINFVNDKKLHNTLLPIIYNLKCNTIKTQNEAILEWIYNFRITYQKTKILFLKSNMRSLYKYKKKHNFIFYRLPDDDSFLCLLQGITRYHLDAYIQWNNIQQKDGVVDFTKYTINYAQTNIYKLILNDRLRLTHYKYKNHLIYQRFGQDICKYRFVYENVNTLIIDTTNMSKIKLKKVLLKFPNVQEISITNNHFLFHPEEYYMLLRNKIYEDDFKNNYQDIPDYRVVKIKHNGKYSVCDILKSCILCSIMPLPRCTDLNDKYLTGFFIFTPFFYLKSLFSNQNILFLHNNLQSLCMIVPLITLISSSIILKNKKHSILWGKHLSRYVTDNQHWSFYYLRHSTIFVMTLCWLFIKMQYLLNKHESISINFPEDVFFAILLPVYSYNVLSFIQKLAELYCKQGLSLSL
ncbi:hypothetical protein EKK58_03550 [Candidatus Dependentiae bacterium]|nr:MAG: hypothetical protein EKK58_03550 [Candidatus Dependentiae bacterium]